MNRKTKLILLICLPLLGILAGYLLMARQITLIVDGSSSQVTTHAMTVRGALRSAGYQLDPLDQVSPPASSSLTNVNEITLNLSHPIQVYNDSTRQLIPVDTASATPLEILTVAGITPSSGDLVRLNGLPVALDQPVTLTGNTVLQYMPAVSLTINADGQDFTINTAASSLGAALWSQRILVHGGDDINQSFTGAVEPDSSVKIDRARPLIITADERDISTYAYAPTVGEALAITGITLQDLDYSKPAETDPLPEDGRIVVVRVRETLLREEQSIPYTTETQTDETLAAGQTQVVTAGIPGLQRATVRIRYEDGKEVSRKTEEAVILKDPVNQVEIKGTKLVAQTNGSCDAAGTYYKAITVTATSYSPCNSGTSDCLGLTALGTPVQRGVLAVDPAWFPLLKNTKICVPGYGIGIVQDTGSYPGTHYWIDLGYTDAEFAAASPNLTFHNLTVYLLGPFPNGTAPELP